MLKNQKEALSLLHGLVGAAKTSPDCELQHDVLPNPLATPEQLTTISKTVLDDRFKKKVVIKEFKELFCN